MVHDDQASFPTVFWPSRQSLDEPEQFIKVNLLSWPSQFVKVNLCHDLRIRATAAAVAIVDPTLQKRPSAAGELNIPVKLAISVIFFNILHPPSPLALLRKVNFSIYGAILLKFETKHLYMFAYNN